MRVSAAIWVLSGVFALLLSGCAERKAEVVYVNLGALARDLPTPTAGLTEVRSEGLRADGGVVPGARELSLGVSDLRATIAKSQAEVLANQELALQRILAQRLRVLDAEVESALQAARAMLRPEHDQLIAEAIARTRDPFDRTAPEVGQLTIELAKLIGFPDVGQSFQTVDADWSRARAARVDEIRARLRELDEQYLNERDAILSEAANRIQADLDRLRSNSEVARLEGLTRLRESLRLLSLRATEEPQLGAPPPWVLESVADKATEVSSAIDMVRLVAIEPDAKNPRWVAETQAKIWAAHRGYLLASTPQEGRDATQECLEWIRQTRRGP